MTELADTDSSSWASLAFDQRWRLAQTLGALERFGLRGKPMKHSTRDEIELQSALVARGATLIIDAASEFPLLFERLRAPRRTGEHVQTYAEAWPGLVRLLRSQLEGPAFTWMRQELDGYAERLPTDAAVLIRRAAASVAIGGAAGLARKLGIRIDRIPQILQESGLKLPERTSRTGRRMRVVPAGTVERLRGHLADFITARAAQRRFGLAKERLEILADAALIQRADDRYGAKSLQALIERLPRRLCAAVGTEDPVTLQQALRLLVPKDVTRKFFDAVLCGDIVLWRSIDVPCSTRELSTSRALVRAWLVRSTSSEQFVLIPQAAQVLGLKQEVAYHLAKVGHLRVSVRQAGRRRARVVLLSDLQEFRETTASWSAAAVELGLSPKASIRDAEPMGFQVISGPSVDGGRQYFVRRLTASHCASAIHALTTQ